MRAKALIDILGEQLRRPLGEATSLMAMREWPVKSRTSYAMVSGLVAQGVPLTTVVDVGANRGQFAVAVLELASDSKVHSFEPLSKYRDHFATLVDHYQGRLAFSPCAVGRTVQTLKLSVNAHDQSSSLLPLGASHLAAFPGATEVATEQVEVRRLDQIIERDQLDPHAMLKIDVQGFEQDVLEGAGALLSSFRYVLVEASFQPLYGGEWGFVALLDFMTSRGFSFLRPVGFLCHPKTREFLQMDALFVRHG